MHQVDSNENYLKHECITSQRNNLKNYKHARLQNKPRLENKERSMKICDLKQRDILIHTDSIGISTRHKRDE